MPNDSDAPECRKCSPNFWSSTGAETCVRCSDGTISEDGLECRPCDAGTFRSGNLTECTPCPFGTFAADPGATECLSCPSGKLCPVATAEPIDVSLRMDRTTTAPSRSQPAAGRARRLANAFALGARRLLQTGGSGTEIETQTEEFKYAQNSVSVTQPVVKTEHGTLDSVNKTFMWVGIGVLIGVAMLALVFVGCLWFPGTSPESKQARISRLRWMHFLFKEEAKHRRIEADSDSSDTDVNYKWQAMSFVVVQYKQANYTIVQSLNPGTSPSAGAITGLFGVSATFRGYGGPCDNSDASIDVAGFGGQGQSAFEQVDGGRSCKVSWVCLQCRIAANDGIHVTLRLRSSLAFAVSVLYSMKVPYSVTLDGIITTTAEDSVFRGKDHIDVPVDLTPMHFTSAADGSPRYHAAVSSSATELAERNPLSFVVCPPGRAASECAEAVVTFRAKFKPSQVYLLVDRLQRTTPLDAAADVLALGEGALKAVACAIAIYVWVRRTTTKLWPKLGASAPDLDLGSPENCVDPKLHGDQTGKEYAAFCERASAAAAKGKNDVVFIGPGSVERGSVPR
eukprot:tig00020660_g12528.t1